MQHLHNGSDDDGEHSEREAEEIEEGERHERLLRVQHVPIIGQDVNRESRH